MDNSEISDNPSCEIGTEAKENECLENRTNIQQTLPEISNDVTAGKILNLISEIGSNDMLCNDQFHPWFWEHSPGKLINV